jgi:hypothetical protein
LTMAIWQLNSPYAQPPPRRPRPVSDVYQQWDFLFVFCFRIFCLLGYAICRSLTSRYPYISIWMVASRGVVMFFLSFFGLIFSLCCCSLMFLEINYWNTYSNIIADTNLFKIFWLLDYFIMSFSKAAIGLTLLPHLGKISF